MIIRVACVDDVDGDEMLMKPVKTTDIWIR